ncbi:unnamed protein product [Moneuplotes crassus]|uniref:Uncharacterized protein n=1 Tax=Euplotes crassus TaxID=5936 RepID=A0AAD2D7I4_EUPCR|nr:unnamed protein product [Moneuplotes crassus]
MLVEECFDNLMESSNEEDYIPSIDHISSISHGVSILADLNDTAIECMEKDLLEEAGESLLQAIEAIPKIQSLLEKEPIKKQMAFDYSYICTIFYNMAVVYQKCSSLEDCRLFLDKTLQCMKKLDIFKFNQKTVDVNLQQGKDNSEFGKNYIPKTSNEINSALVILRFLSKYTLQYCAVLSQLSLHEEALQKSKEAALYCQ